MDVIHVVSSFRWHENNKPITPTCEQHTITVTSELSTISVDGIVTTLQALPTLILPE